jgi:prepilin-type N-terminal cleavage/methylation domain-containing protein
MNLSKRHSAPVLRSRRGPDDAVPGEHCSRRGSTLVEVMIAMSVMVIALTGLAGMTIQAGKRSSTLAGTGARTAVQTQIVDQLMVLPYASLPSKAGCTTVTTLPFPHRRCVTVTDVSFRRRQVKVVFTPTSRLLRPDSITFERSKGVSSSPLG